VQVLPDGPTRPLPDRTDWSRVDAMTEEEVHAAAMADHDARPMTPEEMAKAKQVRVSEPCAARLVSLKRNSRRGITVRSARCGIGKRDAPNRISRREPISR
jgi:hypothetical protein